MKNYLIIILFFLGLQSHAGILWVGGEDMDFQGGVPVCNITNSGFYRAGFARTSLYSCTGGWANSTTTFNSGPVTSVWISGRVRLEIDCSGFGLVYLFGTGKSGTGHSLFVGTAAYGTPTRLGLYKNTGGTVTALASETGNSLAINGITKIDMEIINYGVLGTVNVYTNGSSVAKISYTGDLTMGGNTSLNDVRLSGGSMGCSRFTTVSELIAADTDTRALSVVTMTPNASGTINNWSGGFANINPVTIDDGVNITSTTPGEVFQTEVSNLPSNGVSIQSVKIAARSFSNGGSPSSLSLGVFTNGSVSEPAAVALTPLWDSREAYYHTNPVTTMPWLPTEINLLQLNLKSAP